MSTPENFAPFMPHGEATEASVAATLRGAVELMGPDGSNWIKGELRDGAGDYCLVGALEQAAPNYESYAAARDALKETIGDNHLDRWNNSASYPDVKSAVDRTLVGMGEAPTPVYIPPPPVIPPPSPIPPGPTFP